MSTPLMKKITGRLVDQQGAALQQIAPGITVVLTTSLSGDWPGGWIGSGAVKTADATFEIFTTYDLAASETVSYKVNNGNETVQAGNTTVTNLDATITLSPGSEEQLTQAEITGYTLVKGKITLGDAAIAAVPVPESGLSVVVYKEKFRSSDQLGQSTIDVYGNYEVKVPNRLLSAPVDACEQPSDKVYVKLLLGGVTTIARSYVVELDGCCTTINLHVDEPSAYSLFLTEVDNLLDVVTDKGGISEGELYDVAVEGDNPEITALAATTGLEADKVSKLIRAAIIADVLGVSLNQSYALVCFGSLTVYDASSLEPEEIAEAAARAETLHQTPAITATDQVVKAAQDLRGALAGEELTDNGDTMQEVLTVLLGSYEDTQTFFRLSTEEPDITPQDLWQKVNAALGAVQTTKLQKGIQLLGLTGMQAELSEALVREVNDQPVYTLAVLQQSDWESRINTVKAANPTRPCIPKVILDEFAGETAVPEFARRIKEAITDLFPTQVLLDTFSKDSGFYNSIPDAGQVVSYLSGRPEYEFRRDSVWDITDNDTVRNAMMPLQNLLRLTQGEPDAVVALSKAQMRSSTDIGGISEEEFMERFAGYFWGGAEKAVATYRRAVHTAKRVEEAKVVMNASNYLTTVFPMTVLPEALPEFAALAAAPPAATPDVETMFGNLELCNCSACSSMYSPGAYFTDILNFIRTKLGTNSPSFGELMRRRPDLQHIDLTCKNANTPIPYVDLVNELLEAIVLKNMGTPVPASFQTSGTASELAAYPEHTYKDPATGEYLPFEEYKSVYDTTLKQKIYPNILPFDLAVEESRTYLQHLGAERYDLMHQFRPRFYLTDMGAGTISEYNAMAEWLKLPRAEADIISGDNTAATYLFYGFSSTDTTWYDLLCNGASAGEGLKTLLHRSRISYKEMLQLLTCDFINPEEEMLINTGGQNVLGMHRHFVIVSDDGSPTCDISRLKIYYKKGDDLQTPAPVAEATAKAILWEKWHRFLRLKRATGWTFYQLDMVLKSFQVDGTYTASGVAPAKDITNETFRYVAKTHQLAMLLGCKPEQACTLWSPLSNTRYINFDSDDQNKFPSLYDTLFRNKAVQNPPAAAFAEDGPAGTATFGNQKAAVIAAMGITEEELLAILALGYGDENTQLNLANLGLLYGFSVLCKGLKIAVADAVHLCRLFDTGVPLLYEYDSLKAVEDWIDKVARLKKTAFRLDETAYLCANEDEEHNFIAEDEVIAGFYTGLRADLRLLDLTPFPAGITNEEIEVRRSKLKAVISQHFTEAFGINRENAVALLDSMVLNGTVLKVSDALQDFDFIASEDAITPGNGVAAFDYARLYEAYWSIDKAALVISKLRLNPVELSMLIDKTEGLEIMPLAQMPFAVPATAQETAANLLAFIRLNEWVMVRDRLNIRKQEFASLLEISAGGGTMTAWIGVLAQATLWKEDELTTIFSLLEAVYNPSVIDANDCRRAALVLQMADIIASCKLIGLNPGLVAENLTPAVVLSLSGNIRLAAKSRYNEAEWTKVAKPLQDVLRERQRQSLVAYITGTPGIINVTGTANYRDEKALYEFLLIDVEMKPCMKTSRIKQGISSVQLFMDRIILSLENVNGNYGSLISIPPDKVKQWETWRKWYRVWEANRKIFLYPENWIEPELRDDKTPFFRETETQLLQDEVTSDTAERAFRDYLDKLDDVARLEPVGMYHQVEEGSLTAEPVDIVHVFARTQSSPNRYYYRKLEDNEWSPWEKMNVDIKSDHIAPMVWNGRLFLFWLTFKTKKPANNTGTSSPDSWSNKVLNTGIVKDTDNDKTGIIEATLNWTEFKDDKWQPTQSCKEVLELDIDRVRAGSTALASYTPQANTAFKEQFAANGDMKLDELFINRINFYVCHTDYNPNKELNLVLQFAYGLDEVAVGLRAFIWKDSTKEPYVLRDIDNDGGYSIIAPPGVRFNKNRLVRFKNQKLNVNNSYAKGDGYFIYLKDYVGGFLMARGTSSPVLNSTPYGFFKVLRNMNSHTGDPAIKERDPLLNLFFFEDDRHTFFVRKETGTYAVQQKVLLEMQSAGTAVISIGVAKDVAKNKYPTTDRKIVSTQVTKTRTLYSNGNLYRFYTFYHSKIHEYVTALNREGVPGLLQLHHQRQDDNMLFGVNYQPNTSLVHVAYPTDKVQFGFSDPYSIYNWELFFHLPMMIAQRLSDNQQFEEARKWYHYIFDPTSNRDGLTQAVTGEKWRFWKFQPFYEQAHQAPVTLEQLIQNIHANMAAEIAQVDKWEKNPFKPHVIARMRILAYMKNVLMKYLDNLIAWGDQLFRRDTLESINEATQLYVLAAHLLGRKPEEVPARASAGAKTFEELAAAGLDALSNALVTVESYFAPNEGPLPAGKLDGHREGVSMFYFCLPKNDKLMSYWDTIADRLFKIRNCMNIEGTTRDLALYEPPIDPALLVRAAAKGIDIGTVLNSLSGINNPHYRFNYVLQKANEFCNDVRSLGGGLLAALEKKDAEQLALIRSGQEIRLLEKIKGIKEAQVQEAEANLAAARKTRENTELRRQYYAGRVFMNGGENQYLKSLQAGMVLQTVQGGLQTAASAVSIIPQFHGQASFAIGPSFGGQQIAAALNAISTGLGIAAAINNGRGTMALTRAGYERRMDDWQFQASTAAKELEQLDQQILGSEIRLDVARRELSNHELQMANTAETDAFMRSKFTNVELYNWMSGQIAATYFQSYQLAFDMAKKAEACFDLELPGYKKPAAGFIGFAYWDSLRKGLQSGEKLQFDLRKMESAYMDGNLRELELTKSISLAMTDPQALLDLRNSGSCYISLPETLFDMDYPGHYLRRMKSVSLSLPCVAGPYTTIPATLTLSNSAIRRTAADPLVSDSSLEVSIATSGAQNDSGVFELNFRDERYLPFENRGAVSDWELRLTDEGNDQIRLFDFETISDVILQVRYTARDGGATLRASAIAAVNSLLENQDLPRYCSLKHEFSNEWFAAFQATEDVGGQPVGRKFDLELKRSLFPAYAGGKTIDISKIAFYLKRAQPYPDTPVTVYKLAGVTDPIATATLDSKEVNVSISLDPDTDTQSYSFTLYKEEDGSAAAVSQDELADLYLVISYTLQS